jgi:hypothetical protein
MDHSNSRYVAKWNKCTLGVNVSALKVGLDAKDHMRVPDALPVVADLAAAKAACWTEAVKHTRVVKIGQLVAELAPRITTVDASVEASPAYKGRAILVATRALGCAVHVGGVRGRQGSNAREREAQNALGVSAETSNQVRNPARDK